jgi:hypothetical protein
MLTTRRDLLELAMRAAALPGGAEFMATWLKAQEHNHAANSSAPPEKPLFNNYQPKFFSPEDFEALQAFTEILIPTDDTPRREGSRLRALHRFSDDRLGRFAGPETMARCACGVKSEWLSRR